MQLQKTTDSKFLAHSFLLDVQFFVKSYVCSCILNTINMCFGVINHVKSILQVAEKDSTNNGSYNSVLHKTYLG